MLEPVLVKPMLAPTDEVSEPICTDEGDAQMRRADERAKQGRRLFFKKSPVGTCFKSPALSALKNTSKTPGNVCG